MSFFNNLFSLPTRAEKKPVVKLIDIYDHVVVLVLANGEAVTALIQYNQELSPRQLLSRLLKDSKSIESLDNPKLAINSKSVVSLKLVSVSKK